MKHVNEANNIANLNYAKIAVFSAIFAIALSGLNANKAKAEYMPTYSGVYAPEAAPNNPANPNSNPTIAAGNTYATPTVANNSPMQLHMGESSQAQPSGEYNSAIDDDYESDQPNPQNQARRRKSRRKQRSQGFDSSCDINGVSVYDLPDYCPQKQTKYTVDVGTMFGFGGQFDNQYGLQMNWGFDLGFSRWGKNGLYLGTVATVGYGDVVSSGYSGFNGGVEQRIGYTIETKKGIAVTPYLVGGMGVGYASYSVASSSNGPEVGASDLSLFAKEGLGVLIGSSPKRNVRYGALFLEILCTQNFSQGSVNGNTSAFVYSGIGMVGNIGVQYGF